MFLGSEICTVSATRREETKTEENGVYENCKVKRNEKHVRFEVCHVAKVLG